MPEWLLDGRPDGLMAPTGRGLQYGDGLFETIAFHAGRAALWSRHMDRLMRGCVQLGLDRPDPDVLLAEARSLLDGPAPQVIRITLTRAGEARGYAPRGASAVQRIVARRGWPAALQGQREHGLRLVTSSFRPRASRAGPCKHLNRLDQVLIGREVDAAGVDEALVLDEQHRLLEALSGNLVVERAGRLLAPRPHPAAVAGVGLAWLRDAAADALIELPLARAALRDDDGLWVINAVRGPCPVRELDGRPRPIGARVRDWQARWQQEIEA
ncbi:MAG: aminotransferase class IV [Wenzhouxiangellaceae bacterium]|nr:aminotransferase class IV [Wenzhouxiangellaceae bacterium]